MPGNSRKDGVQRLASTLNVYSRMERDFEPYVPLKKGGGSRSTRRRPWVAPLAPTLERTNRKNSGL